MSSSQPPSGKRKPLGFDELIAIVVAFGTMGAIFFWVTGRNPDRLNAKSWQFPAVFSQPAAEPGNSTILTPPEASPEVRSPATRTIVPSQPDIGPVVPFGPVLPAVPPMGTVVVPQRPIDRETAPSAIGTVVVPQKPIDRETAPSATTKPKAAKPKAGPVKLSDVPDNYWARPFIVALVDRQIFTDITDNKFRPDEPMTRAELARLIQRIADKEPRRKPVDFKDVEDNSPIAPAIDHSVKTGYLKGYPDNAFRPDKEVPRVEVIAALASGLNLKPPAKPSRTLQVYTDRKKLPKWALNRVAAATEAGIVVNHPKPTLLQPNRIATRAEVAAMIYEAMAKQGKVPVKASDYVVKPVKPSK